MQKIVFKKFEDFAAFVNGAKKEVDDSTDNKELEESSIKVFYSFQPLVTPMKLLDSEGKQVDGFEVKILLLLTSFMENNKKNQIYLRYVEEKFKDYSPSKPNEKEIEKGIVELEKEFFKDFEAQVFGVQKIAGFTAPVGEVG